MPPEEPFIIPSGLPDALKETFNRGFRIEALLIHQNTLIAANTAALEKLMPVAPTPAPAAATS